MRKVTYVNSCGQMCELSVEKIDDSFRVSLCNLDLPFFGCPCRDMETGREVLFDSENDAWDWIERHVKMLEKLGKAYTVMHFM